ncbi:MAG: molybdopterin-guanine dinucleotide biosynthesis protein B [Proteobacteria bacterium]|nr:molybdopterin-guanine dinucleotide biosynthesis protein B [Pseudomonadota bacterium]
MTPIISIVGKAESGKTTLIERLILELKKRGYKIGTLKHAFHGFDMDKKGKDSQRHIDAGADTTIIVSKDRIVINKNNDGESLDLIAGYITGVDIVITEGFKKDNKPKIEVFRKARHEEPACIDDNNLFAFVTDDKIDITVPKFSHKDINGIADLIENKFL